MAIRNVGCGGESSEDEDGKPRRRPDPPVSRAAKGPSAFDHRTFGSNPRTGVKFIEILKSGGGKVKEGLPKKGGV